VAKRDPNKTALNKRIAAMTSELKAAEDHVGATLHEPTVLALHGRIGGKNAEFIDVKNEVIYSPEEYVALWIRGFLEVLEQRRPLIRGDSYFDIFRKMRSDKVVEQYIITFLKRTYLRNREGLSRVRPRVEDAEVWIGQERASYGILVTPRFVKQRWENDKSEIRKFPQDYWTIGHVLSTGLVVPGDPDKIEFADVNSYLAFFKNTLVRLSGSSHERAVATRYVEYVRAQSDPTKVPLLIPEFRYNGIEPAHKYRLDFTVIDPYSLRKVGFELSPWSTHGLLKGIKNKTQKEVNDEAQANFEREMQKHKDYFRKHGVWASIYTDKDLADPDELFEDIKRYLVPTRVAHQLEIHALDELRRFKP
jgi:hypothetical protein